MDYKAARHFFINLLCFYLTKKSQTIIYAIYNVAILFFDIASGLYERWAVISKDTPIIFYKIADWNESLGLGVACPFSVQP